MSSSRRHAGFSLVEILIVILIVGILAVVGVAAFNGQRNKAKNTAAQSALRSAFIAGRTYFNEKDTWQGISVDEINKVESSISPTSAAGSTLPGPSASPNQIWIALSTDASVVICAASKGDTSYCIAEITKEQDPAYLAFDGAYRSKVKNGSLSTAFGALASEPRQW